MADEKLTIPIGVPVDTNAAAAADDVEDLRTQIEGSLGDIKAMSASFKMLRGSTDEVKAAKTQLTAKIDALKNSVSGASLALVKQGTSYDAAAQRAKKLADEQKKLAASAKAAAGVKTKSDAADAMKKTKDEAAALKEKLKELKADAKGADEGLASCKTAALGAYAAIAALIVGIAAAGIALTKFILTSGDAARSANLVREAWSGTAKNASNLGTQIDALADKVPTSKAALNELAVKLMALRLPGQATVDTFNAIGQASAALGDEAAGKLQEFITRGRQFGMLRLNKREMLEGFGNLDFDDIAKALAKNMGLVGAKGVAAAAEALRVGKVKIGDGAKAIRDAIEAKFGDINLRKMMSLEVISQKLSEKWAALTSGVNLEPLLKPLSELGKLFDSSTVTGATLKQLVTTFGDAMVKNLVAGIPIAKAFFEGLIVGALHVYIGMLKVRNQLRETFGDSASLKNIDVLKTAMTAGKYAAIGIAAAIATVGAVMLLGMAPILAMGYALKKWNDALSGIGKTLRETFLALDWAAIGKAIPEGILDGINAGIGAVENAVGSMADGVRKKFKLALGIASPSKVFRADAKEIPAGTAKGIEDGAPKAQAAASAMVSAAGATSGGGAGGGGRGGATVNLYLTINAGAGGEQAARALADESFLKKLTKAIEDSLVGAGIPVLG